MGNNIGGLNLPRDAGLDGLGTALIAFGMTQPEFSSKALLVGVGLVLVVLKYVFRGRAQNNKLEP